MPDFSSDGLRLHYMQTKQDASDRASRAPFPVLLLHGLASNSVVNWLETGWWRTLSKAGWPLIALDLRGHGRSAGPLDAESYQPARIVGDIVALLAHTRQQRVALLGYSLGARVAAFFAAQRPQNTAALILGGMASRLTAPLSDTATIAEAFRAPSIAEVESAIAKTYRQFAERNNGQLPALAAAVTGLRVPFEARRLSAIQAPTLVVAGTCDPIAGDPDRLAAQLPHASAVRLPGRNHMNATGDRAFKQSAITFLALQRKHSMNSE